MNFAFWVLTLMLIIGIDASRAFRNQRTGIEEYSYQVIKHLTGKLSDHQVVLYLQENQKIDFDLPPKWKVKVIKMPRLWTQIGLSLEMLFHPVDKLFIPAHVVPVIHPKDTTVVVHGLEYEVFPEGYSFWSRMYMRWSIKMSCRWAKRIIAVSENTKRDLMKLYGVPEEKIEVVYEGISSVIASEAKQSRDCRVVPRRLGTPRNDINRPYLLFIGRLEKRKNIEGIIEAYKILKEKYDIPHKLVLAGGSGYGFDIIKLKIANLLKIENCKLKIICLGYIDEATKYNLLASADVYAFPTFYEGFGLPILEAQSAGVPVVCSNVSSLPEIVDLKTRPCEQLSRSGLERDCSVVLCDPKNPESIAEAVYKLISNPELKDDIIKKGYENASEFSWSRCANQIAKVLIDK